MIYQTKPQTVGPSRVRILAYILAVLAAFAITLASVGAAHAAVLDGLTTELRQATSTYDPPAVDDSDDLSNQPMPSDDNPDNT